MIRARSMLPVLACAVSLVGCVGTPSEGPQPPESEESERSFRRGGRFWGMSLYVEPDNAAAEQAELWRDSDPEGAELMDELAAVPGALWLGDWMDDVASEVDEVLDRAGDAVPVFVLYNIPQRDCGSMSAGGAASDEEYADFVDQIAVGLEGRLAIVVAEPDGLALTTCLSDEEWDERAALLSDAVDTLEAAGGAVYLDAGHSGWISAEDMATRLQESGVDNAHGFALNVAHTEYSDEEAVYAEELRDLLGRKARYVIDTGRNGVGPAEDHEWCNPLGRKNGDRPSLDGGAGGLDAKLWIKLPGSSDGWCNGGPAPGTWWPEYARDLAL
jgi:endoglucanase